MKILNFGSLNIDYVYEVNEFVKEGETILSNAYHRNIGGKGLNQSIAFARAGLPIFHAGKVGLDGKFMLEYLKENGVNIDNIYIDDGESGHAIIQVNSVGQNTIILNGGANQRIKKEEIDAVLNNFEKGDFLILQNEINSIDYIIDKAYEKGLRIAINVAPVNGKEKLYDLSKVEIINVNETEGQSLTGKSKYNEILADLKSKFPNAVILLTLGSNGSICSYKEKEFKQGIYKVKPVDATSAGDTFFGYFLKEFVSSGNIEKALDLGAKASAICVSRKGASISIPKFDEIK